MTEMAHTGEQQGDEMSLSSAMKLLCLISWSPGEARIMIDCPHFFHQ